MRTVLQKCLYCVALLMGISTLGHAQMSGTYSIDPSGSGSRNYTSIGAAITAVTGTSGISDTVVFEIEAGTYTGQLNFTRTISNTNWRDRVIFRGATGDPTDVIITNTGTYTIYGTASDYVTFEDVTIENTRTSFSYNVYLSGADKMHFNNCRILKPVTSNFTYNFYVRNTDSTSLNECLVRGGYYAVYLRGPSRTSGNVMIMENSAIYRAEYMALYSYYSEDLTFNNNVIDTLGRSNAYSFYSYYGNRSEIKNNKFFDGIFGFSYENFSGGSSRDTSDLHNNMISNPNGGYSWFGFYPYRVRVFNNSIYGASGSFASVYVFRPTGSRIMNNNIEGSGSTYGMYMPGTPRTMDYNNLYLDGGNVDYYFNTGTYADLAAMQSGNSNYHQNSISVDPDYEDDERNLRTFCPLVNNSGILLLSEDIDGNARPNASDDPDTDIGCNEYYVAPKDLDIRAITSPLSVSTSANTISARFRNAGSDTLKNEIVTFQYSVDSGATWISQNDTIVSLAPKGEINFTFDSTWTPTRVGDFRIHVKADPSVSNDPDNNDETFIDVCSGLAGTYTVGRPGNDFATLADAFAKLECGIAGPTTFQLAGGNGGTQATYSRLHINGLNGTGANQTLTIDGQHPDSVLINSTSGSFIGAIDIENTDWIIVKNMTVRHSSGGSVGLKIHSGSDNNVFENLDVACPTSGRPDWNNCNLAMSSSVSGATAASNNLVKDCSFRGGYYVANIRGSGGSNSFSNRLENCLFADHYYWGLYVQNQDSFQFVNNRSIKNLTRYQFGYNMYMNSCSRSLFVQNELVGHAYGCLYLVSENRGTSYRSLIANNIIDGITDNTSTYGRFVAYATSCEHVDWYHNTIVCNPSTPSTRTGGFGQNIGLYLNFSTDINVDNNILISLDDQGTGIPYGDRTVTFANNSFDYNTIISAGSNFASVNGSNVADLAGLQAAHQGTNLNSSSDPVAFAGTNIYYLSTTTQNRRAPAIQGITEDVDGDSRCLFAASIGADESGYPTPTTRAFFAVDDTVFINSPVTFSNAAGAKDPIFHQWYVDGVYVGDEVDLEYRFTSTGTYDVSVVSEGCGGLDSFGRQVTVVLPTSAPDADYLVSSRVVDVNEPVSFTNISTNGPDSFYWVVDSYFVRGQFGFRIPSHTYVNGTDSNSLNPEIEFLEPGTYSVCLYAYNLRGADSTCKTQLISVRQTVDLCGVTTFSSNYIGKLFDEGGAAGSYTGNRNNCNFLLDPCTDEITLTFNQFDLAAGSYLRIYDGRDNTGTPLHSYSSDYSQGLTGRSDAPNFRTKLTATSGEVYFEFESGQQVAAGFEIEWDANVVSASTPVAGFNLPDTVCAEVPFAITNSTTGLDVDFKWYMDTSNINWFNGADYVTEDIVHQYDFAGTYYIKMNADNCGGADSVIQSIVVVAPTSAPTPDFVVDNSRPSIGDKVSVTNTSTSGGYPCIGEYEWTVSPSTFSYVDGFNRNSENPQFLFSDTGCYDITLTVSNSAGDSSYTMNCAVYSISTCIPNVKIPNTDVGISRVVIGNIDNTSGINEDGYENFVNGTSTNLEVGASYDITIERPVGYSNDMNRAVWVDYNQDGVFDNSTEMVASSNADGNLSWTGNFTIPSTAIKGSTRLRVGANLGSFSQFGCGPNQFGEFEDYRVFVTADQQAPMIVLNGSADTTIEQCSAWNDPSASGMDNVDGSISLSGTLGSVNASTPGVYTITYEATDAAGNVGRDTRTVRVTADATEPTITLSGMATMDVEVFSTYTEPGFTADDNCGGIGASDVVVSGTVDNTELGIYTIAYTVTDNNGLSNTVTRTVNVVDTEAPVITNVLGDNPALVEVLTPYVEAGVEWTENYDTTGLNYSVSGLVDVSTPGTYTLRYTVTDNSGNVSAEAVRTVEVADRTAPQLRMAFGDTTITIDVYDRYSPEWIDIDDNFSSESAVRSTLAEGGTYVQTFGKSVATETGSFTYTYTAEDEAGNSTTVTRNIEVVDREAPVMEFTDGSVINLPRWTPFDPLNDVAYTLSDNYHAAATLTVSLNSNNVDVNATGTYQMEYEVSDPDGNSATYTYTVVVGETIETLNLDETESIITSIYPNPTSGQLNVQVQLGTVQQTEVALVNSVGQVVHNFGTQTGVENNFSADLSHLNSGVYYVRIVSGNQQMIQKVTLIE